tara:strand:- start:21 stop:458 length:438 start_codon:yes stop_codon:yes gene_type:complete
VDKRIDRFTLSHLECIKNPKGDIYHGIKSSSSVYKNFGESYFSFIDKDVIKGWKKHTKVTLNICVPVGAIKFVIHSGNRINNEIVDADEIILSKSNYKLLTIPPGSWVAFKGLELNQNLLLNIIDYEHDPSESLNADLSYFKYNW